MTELFYLLIKKPQTFVRGLIKRCSQFTVSRLTYFFIDSLIPAKSIANGAPQLIATSFVE